MSHETPNPTPEQSEADVETFLAGLEAEAIEAANHEAWLHAEWLESTIGEVSPEESLRAIRAKHHVYTSDELSERIRVASSQRYLIAEMLAMRSTAIMIGRSGIGKSPLLYQLGLCVAAGKPFFNYATTQGLVLYADFENNIKKADGCAKTIAEFIGLPGVPKEFLSWNAHDAAPGFNADRVRSLIAMIKDVHPTLTIIDTLSKAFPDAEEKNSEANKVLTVLTDLVSGIGGGIILSHHYKKTQSGRGSGRSSPATIQELLAESRGASALTAGVDLRLAIAEPPKAKTFADADAEHDKPSEVECAFEIGVQRRMSSDLRIAVERVYRDGIEVGYRQIIGVTRLRNPRYQQVFEALPDPFRPKDVEAYFPSSGASVQQWFKACASAGIITAVDLAVVPGYRCTRGFAKVVEVKP